MVPVQLDINMSSPSANPYEHASNVTAESASTPYEDLGLINLLLNLSRLSQAPPKV
jgi:hypothetical protein